MKTKVYLAGSCSSEQRTMMQKVASKLHAEQFEVYCPFELKIPNAWDMCQEDWAYQVFLKDIGAPERWMKHLQNGRTRDYFSDYRNRDW